MQNRDVCTCAREVDLLAGKCRMLSQHINMDPEFGDGEVFSFLLSLTLVIDRICSAYRLAEWLQRGGDVLWRGGRW